MKICKIIGTIVSTKKDEKLDGFKLLLAQPISVLDQTPESEPLVAVDTVGAGVGEVVMIAQGSSARQSKRTENRPIDANIMAIVDFIDIEGKRTFSKS